jgi:hypothetical protein
VGTLPLRWDIELAKGRPCRDSGACELGVYEVWVPKEGLCWEYPV